MNATGEIFCYFKKQQNMKLHSPKQKIQSPSRENFSDFFNFPLNNEKRNINQEAIKV